MECSSSTTSTWAEGMPPSSRVTGVRAGPDEDFSLGLRSSSIATSGEGLERQLDHERSASARLGTGSQAPAVALHDVMAHIEPQPGASGLGGEEGLEQALPVLDRNAGPFVF